MSSHLTCIAHCSLNPTTNIVYLPQSLSPLLQAFSMPSMVSMTSQPILYDNQVTLARPMSPCYHQVVSSPNSSLSVSGLDDWGNPTNQESCHIPNCQPQPRWTLTVAMSGTWPLQCHRTDADINTFFFFPSWSFHVISQDLVKPTQTTPQPMLQVS